MRRCLTRRGWETLQILNYTKSLVLRFQRKIRNRKGNRARKPQLPDYELTLRAARDLVCYGNLENNLFSLCLLAEMLQARRNQLLGLPVRRRPNVPVPASVVLESHPVHHLENVQPVEGLMVIDLGDVQVIGEAVVGPDGEIFGDAADLPVLEVPPNADPEDAAAPEVHIEPSEAEEPMILDFGDMEFGADPVQAEGDIERFLDDLIANPVSP